ncbi:hypothetical protein K438DRAFT_2009780 [Mycena galopus ATCC 62051]|nr:hypothetical protein K438DRAFT_2009780 [Mycena galopus ATCC 62051]
MPDLKEDDHAEAEDFTHKREAEDEVENQVKNSPIIQSDLLNESIMLQRRLNVVFPDGLSPAIRSMDVSETTQLIDVSNFVVEDKYFQHRVKRSSGVILYKATGLLWNPNPTVLAKSAVEWWPREPPLLDLLSDVETEFPLDKHDEQGLHIVVVTSDLPFHPVRQTLGRQRQNSVSGLVLDRPLGENFASLSV